MFRRNKVDRAIQECQLFHERSKEEKEDLVGVGLLLFRRISRDLVCDQDSGFVAFVYSCRQSASTFPLPAHRISSESSNAGLSSRLFPADTAAGAAFPSDVRSRRRTEDPAHLLNEGYRAVLLVEDVFGENEA
jgi:hypothetical protein